MIYLVKSGDYYKIGYTSGSPTWVESRTQSARSATRLSKANSSKTDHGDKI